MEENNSFHCQLGQVWKVLEEPRKDDCVGGEGQLLLFLCKVVDELADLQILENHILEHDHNARQSAKDDRDILDVSQGRVVHRLEVIGFRTSIRDLFPSSFAGREELVAHGVRSDIQRQAESLSCILHVTAALDYVLWSNFKGSRAIFLFEAACEVPLVVVLPFEQA